MKELIAYAKANPGKSNYASSAGIFQIATEMFKQRTGTAIEMIPYKSSGESVQAVIAGQVMMTIVDPPPATGALKAGTLRGIAVTSAKAPPVVARPADHGRGRRARHGSAGMDRVLRAGEDPAGNRRAPAEGSGARGADRGGRASVSPQMGLDPVGGSSEDLGRQVARDIEKWTAVAKAANIKND